LCAAAVFPYSLVGRLANRRNGFLKSTNCTVLAGHVVTSRKVAGSRPDEVTFLNVPNPSGRTRPWGYSASNRNEYQKQKNNVSEE
jgi:hypothetical protein